MTVQTYCTIHTGHNFIYIAQKCIHHDADFHESRTSSIKFSWTCTVCYPRRTINVPNTGKIFIYAFELSAVFPTLIFASSTTYCQDF